MAEKNHHEKIKDLIIKKKINGEFIVDEMKYRDILIIDNLKEKKKA